jgi:hypothetical protein
MAVFLHYEYFTDDSKTQEKLARSRKKCVTTLFKPNGCRSSVFNELQAAGLPKRPKKCKHALATPPAAIAEIIEAAKMCSVRIADQLDTIHKRYGVDRG